MARRKTACKAARCRLREPLEWPTNRPSKPPLKEWFTLDYQPNHKATTLKEVVKEVRVVHGAVMLREAMRASLVHLLVVAANMHAEHD